MFSDENLPPLDTLSMEHSDLVADAISRKIQQQGGAIKFDEFMRFALYEPGLGYYVAGAEKFGNQGDFVTAPELGSLFGRCVAQQCQQVLAEFTHGEVVEFGGGSGRAAATILRELKELRCLPERYTIIEISPELRERQKQLIQDLAPELVERVHWSDKPPTKPIEGCAIANEVLDALPARYFEVRDGELYEFWVRQGEAGRLTWQTLPAEEALQKALNATPGFNYCLSLPHYLFEIIPAIPAWITDLDSILRVGAAFLFDYGSGRKERYGPAYSGGSLRCFVQHRVHGDPLVYPGVQDITTSVDFTAVAEAAVDAGFQVSGYTDQANFLMGCGILHKVTELQVGADENSVLELNEELKTLLMPTKMGTSFKSIGLTKGYDEPLLGYSLRDHRGSL
jgi:SAM-dependent MidA family methyltransferase